MVIRAYNPRMLEAEAGGLGGWDQPGLYSEFKSNLGAGRCWWSS
jgi:hypothetical protein